MALYNPGAGQTDWRKQLKTVTQQSPAVSAGGQQAGLGGTQQPQARTTQTTHPSGGSAVYNASASPSAAALNPDNINWGTGGTPGAGGTAPNTLGSSANGYGYGQAPAYTAKDPRYGGAYNAENYKGQPTLYYEDNYTTDPNIGAVFNVSDGQRGLPGDEYVADVFRRNAEAAARGGWSPDTGMGMTSAMREIYDTLGTLNVDNAQFYAGLQGTPGMDYASWAAANGIPANGGDNQWGYLMFDNWNKLGGGGAAPGNPNENPPGAADMPWPSQVDQEFDKNKNRNRRNNNNGGGNKGGGGRGNGANGPHGGSGYGPQGQQGPGGGRPNGGGGNKGGGGNNKNNNNGGGNKNNNNKKK